MAERDDWRSDEEAQALIDAIHDDEPMIPASTLTALADAWEKRADNVALPDALSSQGLQAATRHCASDLRKLLASTEG